MCFLIFFLFGCVCFFSMFLLCVRVCVFFSDVSRDFLFVMFVCFIFLCFYVPVV